MWVPVGKCSLGVLLGCTNRQYKLELERNFHQRVRVPRYVNIMGACPDASICGSVFNEAIWRLGHFKVAIGLTHIGRLAPAPTSLAPNSLIYHDSYQCIGNDLRRNM